MEELSKIKFNAAIVAFFTPTPTHTPISGRFLSLGSLGSLGFSLWVRNWLLIFG
jgi:hypothetical protein